MTEEEELLTMTSPPARKVLAANLTALMGASADVDTLPKLEAATATRGGGKKVSKTVLGQVKNGKTPLNLDYLEAIAKVFGLAPWQMLVPGLDPKNPQILRSTGAEEDALYKKVMELRTLAKQIDELESSTDRKLANPIVDEEWHGDERRGEDRRGKGGLK